MKKIFFVSFIICGLNLFSQDQGSVDRGERVYKNICSSCHGALGNGNGPVASGISTKPRDFTKGIFKFRSTESGKLPTDQDLYKTISRGIKSTAMPAFNGLSETDRWSVVKYVKTFSPRFNDQNEFPLVVEKIENRILPSPESIEKGKILYAQMQCGQCHGSAGRGDGPSAVGQTDVWENPVQPRDLTSAHESKLAKDQTDIFRIFTTGLDGTPMPSYKDAIVEADRWHLANYVYELRKSENFAGDVLIPETPNN